MPGWWCSRSAQKFRAELLGEGIQAACSPGRAGVLAGNRPAGRGPGGRRAGSGRSARPGCAARWCSSWASESGRLRPEDAGLAQQPPRHGAVVAGPAVDLRARRRAAPGSRRRSISASVPPLAAMMTAARPMVACRAPAGIWPPSLDGCPQPGEPGRVAGRLQVAGQRPRADAGGRQPGAATGRTMSAQTARISPIDSRSSRLPDVDAAVRPASRAQSCFQPGPGGLGAAGQPPLLPGAAGLVRQASQAPAPRRGAACCGCRGSRAVNGGRAQHAQHLVLVQLGGRPVGGSRAGRERGARGCPCRLACLAAQLRQRRRGGGPASRAAGRSRCPGPEQHAQRLGPVPGRRRRAAPAAGPGVPARRDGPAPGGSRPRPAASGRSASWSAARGRARPARRSAAATDPRPSGRRPCAAARAASPPCRPAGTPARTCGAPRGRSAAGPGGAASTTAAAAARPGSACPSPPGKAAATRTHPVDAGSCCSSPVPLRITVISCRPGSTPPAVADSSSDARAPVDT